ncbi:hypothetical protein SAMN04488505_10334 [Chitinophaga rupis]|uniref:Lipocalin-like domain-containing protein n=1 Tax=Chitinophaga rupis TaxID=573321 RepID=A0A1H7UL55_9BACT|nr:hypothetical protein [Chitinophaga rupis]SEL97516.1 hypothetical protein SAMN04488505_10334 [Chitinophaga rupis]
MRLQKIVMALVAVLSCGSLYAQQASDAAGLKGEWQLIKVEMQVFSQQGNQLLEEKTITLPADADKVSGLVPQQLQLLEHDFVIKRKNSTESGKYMLQGKGVLVFQRAVPQQQSAAQPPAPGITYTYRLQETSELVLLLPASFYKDNNRNQAVKQVYTCYYRKKS